MKSYTEGRHSLNSEAGRSNPNSGTGSRRAGKPRRQQLRGSSCYLCNKQKKKCAREEGAPPNSICITCKTNKTICLYNPTQYASKATTGPRLRESVRRSAKAPKTQVSDVWPGNNLADAQNSLTSRREARPMPLRINKYREKLKPISLERTSRDRPRSLRLPLQMNSSVSLRGR